MSRAKSSLSTAAGWPATRTPEHHLAIVNYSKDNPDESYLSCDLAEWRALRGYVGL
jgi:hypothetical protein